MLRVDPARGFAAVVDRDVVALLSSTWQTPVGGVLLAYNEMTRLTDPGTGEEVLLMGLQARLKAPERAPAANWNGFHADATYLLRHADGRYEVHWMEDPTLATPPPRVAVRTMALSPFDPGAIYAGGFDANKHPAHDTAWALRGTVARVLGQR